MTHLPTIHSFLLLDSAMLPQDGLASVGSGERPDWLLPIYKESAISVSPLVIDIDVAYQSDRCAEMMAMLNAIRPQLHVSIIDTTLEHAELAEHLRRFIMIKTSDGRALSLRFADCLGLPVLAATFSAEQWVSFTGPVKRWCIHGRDGALSDLTLADHQLMPVSTPLVLTSLQLKNLAEASAPDEMMADIREMHHDRAMPGSPAENHRYAVEARRLWREADSTDPLVLRWLTEVALDTSGSVLAGPHLLALLKRKDTAAIREGLTTYRSAR